MEPARARDRIAWPAVAYLTVSVPVIDGWTSHTNGYVPAGRAGTW